MTAASLTQKTYTLSIPASSSLPSISAFLRPGIWHVDQVGVKAPGSETISTLPLEVSDSIGRFSLKLTWRRRGWRR